MIETAEVFQGSSVRELILIFGLDHRRSLAAEEFAGGEEVDDAFVPHPLQHDRQSDEDAGTTNAAAAVNGDRTVLVEGKGKCEEWGGGNE